MVNASALTDKDIFTVYYFKMDSRVSYGFKSLETHDSQTALINGLASCVNEI